MSVTVIEMKRLRPVKWSQVDRKTGSFRDDLVKTFLEFEGRPLLDEDGEPLTDGRGQRDVTVTSFAERYGIRRMTFQHWVFDRRGYSPHPNSREQAEMNEQPDDTDEALATNTVAKHESHGRCSHCPRWTEE